MKNILKLYEKKMKPKYINFSDHKRKKKRHPWTRHNLYQMKKDFYYHYTIKLLHLTF